MTPLLQTISFSQNSEELGEFEGLMAASFVPSSKKRKPEISRRQRRTTRRRRFA